MGHPVVFEHVVVSQDTCWTRAGRGACGQPMLAAMAVCWRGQPLDKLPDGRDGRYAAPGWSRVVPSRGGGRHQLAQHVRSLAPKRPKMDRRACSRRPKCHQHRICINTNDSLSCLQVGTIHVTTKLQMACWCSEMPAGEATFFLCGGEAVKSLRLLPEFRRGRKSSSRTNN